MVNVLTRKLELFGPLPERDKQLLDEVVTRSRSVEGGTTIIEEGDEPSDVHLVLEGLACRYKVLRTGARQILAFLIPGDFCDLNVFILNAMDHGIEALSPCRVVDIPRARILEMMTNPDIARAMWWATLVDEATLREWLVNLGQRDAERGIAHLFCELHLRFRSIGLAGEHSFELPISQAVLGDSMGLSSVHVNRSLQGLRNKKILEFRNGRVLIPDVIALRRLVGFNPNYLHLEGGKRDIGGAVKRQRDRLG